MRSGWYLIFLSCFSFLLTFLVYFFTCFLFQRKELKHLKYHFGLSKLINSPKSHLKFSIGIEIAFNFFELHKILFPDSLSIALDCKIKTFFCSGTFIRLRKSFFKNAFFFRVSIKGEKRVFFHVFLVRVCTIVVVVT